MTFSGTAVNAGHLGAGLRLGIDYNPGNLRFSPSLRLSFGQNRLPLQQNGVNEGAVNFNSSSLLLNVAYNTTIQGRQFAFYGGLGTLKLKRRKTAPSGVATSIISIDSTSDITHFFPAADIGFEYRSVHPGKRFYLSVGICVQYAWLPDGYNIYYLDVSDNNRSTYTKASLAGNLLMPAIYLTIGCKSRVPKNNWYIE